MRTMHILGSILFAWLGASVTSASELSEKDRQAIAAIENQVAPLPAGFGSAEPAPLAQRLVETRVPGVSIAFIENGQVKWTRAYGQAVAGTKKPVTPATRFQAASLSKAVAAVGVLRLVDRNRLTLDDATAEQLGGWRMPVSIGEPPRTPTLRQLLSHTAGLTVAGYPGYARGEAVPTIAQSLAGTAPANTPAVRSFAQSGGQIAYSGGGYSAAQLLMTETTGEAFPRLMRRLVLGPAGMTRSAFEQPLPARHAGPAASGHDAGGKALDGGSNTYPELAAAGLWTTPADYGRFIIVLQNSWAGKSGALLSRASAQAMTTPVMANYGLGVTVIQRAGRVAITHGGSNSGFQSRFVAFLDGAREGVVIMTNGDNGGALSAGLQRTIARAYGWNDTSSPPLPRAPQQG